MSPPAEPTPTPANLTGPTLVPVPAPVPSPLPPPVAEPIPAPASFGPWEEILRAVAVSMIPENYEKTKDWGKQSRVFGGINADVRGGNLRLAKRTTDVNQGLWRRYRVNLVDPGRTLQFSIQDRGERDDRQYLLISAQILADVEARFELWTLGVKGLNGTVRGIGTLRIDVACSYAIETEFDKGLPTLKLVPKIEGLNLTLVDYRAKQIGLLRGDIAEAVGDGSRAVLREIVNGQEEKLLKKLRADVAKKQDRLRIAPGDWLFSKGK